jgi:hypothetical protein
MLEKLVIKNFQCHAKLIIEFDEHVTVLVGASDVGKSAIIRALRWLALNRPQGSAFIRDHGNLVRVDLYTEHHHVQRLRSADGSKNLFKLDGSVFKSFGHNAPSEIEQVLNLGDVNFASQHDAPFWFLKSPGEVSKELNAIVDLGMIDTTLAHAASEVRQTKAVVEVSRSRLQESEREVNTLAWVPKAEQTYHSLKCTFDKLERGRKDCARLREWVGEYRRATKQAIVAQQRANAGQRALALAGRILSQRDLCDNLGNLLNLYKRAKWRAQQRVPPQWGELVALWEKSEELRGELGRLKQLLTDYQDARNQACLYHERAKKAQSELEEKTQGVCPLCGNPFPSP